ncbi:MAG: LCP family protein [Clostridia bacterium]|nr:LCP family protein [Clostridia bacterium]
MSKQRRARIRGLIFLVIGVAVLAGVLIFLQLNENGQFQESRGTMSEGFGTLKTIDWNGQKYREKPAVTTMLIAGVDRDGTITETNTTSYRDGGQADFLLLMAIDHTDKKIYRFQIERDTMAEVDILGVFGNEVGTRILQICLAHSFGATPADNAKYTVRAVQNLLGGLEIDGYYMVDYTSVPVLNDALGGVTVHLDFDMTSVHPEWTLGSTVTLQGKEAEDFVRARMTVGAGTNEERMVRQNEFMTNAIKQMNSKLSENLSFGEELLTTLKDISVTNFTQKRLLEELNQAYNFEIQAVDHPAGEYTIGSDGFVEFHMEEDAAVEWVLNHLYTKVE